MGLVEIFKAIRDVPFKIPLERNEEDNCCNGKVRRLKYILDENGYESRYVICEFKWSDLSIPKELLSIPHVDLSTHLYLEIKIDGNWIKVDPTWDIGLKSIFSISEWDGKTDTKLAVIPTEIYDFDQSSAIMEDETDDNFEKELKDNKNFFRALNEWLESERKKQILTAGEIKKIVKEGYETNSYFEKYRKNKGLTNFEILFLDEFIELLSVGSQVLDWGSGPGVPYDLYLSQNNISITGIDISQKHINIAKKNVPDAKYYLGDFCDFDYGDKQYDGIISLYSIIHVPRDDQANLFKKAHGLLKTRGIALFTIGVNDKSKTRDDFCDGKMAWSHYKYNITLEMIENAGFKIIKTDNEFGHESDENHLWVLAEKI